MKRKPVTLPLGELADVKWNDNRRQNFLDVLYELGKLHLSREERKNLNSLRSRVDDQGEDELELLQDIEAMVTDHCPPFAYFDTESFAVLVEPNIQEILLDDKEGYVTGPNDPRPAWKKGEKPRPFWLDINDHGNMTLYRRIPGGWREIWSVV